MDDSHTRDVAAARTGEAAGDEAAARSSPHDWAAVKEWRKHAREKLIRARLGMSADIRRMRGERANERLMSCVDLRKYSVLGLYWPIRGEIDAHEIAWRHIEAGGTVALPVIVAEEAPVEFWRWRPGMPMRPGRWKIPVPRERELLQPDLVIAPLVGFDRAGFRLGYGSGYYDRTLAAAARRPLAVGLGYADSELDTIHPQPHDVRMDLIVTDQAVFRIG